MNEKECISLAKHMIGMDNKKVYTRHGRKFYKPYRNYFATGKILNPAGEYAVKFAKNHGMSIAEAMERPMVKARFDVFNETGK